MPLPEANSPPDRSPRSSAHHQPSASLRRELPSATHLVHSVSGSCPRQRLWDAYPCVMGLHKLTAGDGYRYLTRQVAVHDTTERGRTSLGDYYDQRGESPGRWFGSGLAGLDMTPGEQVGAEQMEALFGEGRHPNADRIEAAAVADGHSTQDALRSSALGRRFPVHDTQSPFRVEVARRFSDWNLSHGQPWKAAIRPEVRADIRSRVARDLFQVEFDRRPADARELSGFIARASRQPTTAVAGYDLTFSPVKSVSALWAVAPRRVAAMIEQAHDAAVADTLRWIETDVAYTRTGRAGIRQVDVRGLVAAAFTHRDARSGDPDLHTHVAVSNKVQTLDGRWLALDGRVLHKAKVTASERYNTRLEAELSARLGVRFAARDTADGRRPVREITRVDRRLNERWSSRRAQIDVRRGVLAAGFQAAHGRPATEVEALALAQQANLETRAAKHEPRSEAEQRAVWRADAVEVLGSAGQITAMIERAVQYSPARFVVTDGWVTETARTVVETLQQSRATWQAWHVRSEAERRARDSGVGLDDLDVAVQRVVDRALSDDVSIRLAPREPVAEPAPLRRRDGSSVYTVAGSQSYTSAAIVAAEQRLLEAARRTDGRRVDDTTVGVAVAELVANGIWLNDAQAAMVRELACSGSRLQVALAPAGSGKTTAMRVLAQAWVDGGGRVVGLAPSAQAAAELSASIGTRCDTLAKFLTTNRNHTADTGSPGDGIDARTLVIIDEAGMAGTVELAETVDAVVGAGGSVRLIGDHQQLASVAAGGVLRDIAETVGAVTLSELVRFTDRAEAAATLALRAGDPAAVAFYTDRGRVHVGDQATVVDHAYRAWATDRRAGKDSVLLALTRDTVATLNARARADRIAADGPPTGEVTLADGTRASAGDTVITRRNDRRLTLGPTGWVKNGDRWLITGIRPGGSLHVTHLATRSRIVLPSDYVAAHVRLGYACTVHAAQGVTADTAHTVASGDETRQLLYVAMSRGRTGNHVYLVTAGDGDPHTVIKPTTLVPPTAVDRLVDIVARDGSQQSAATTVRDLTAPQGILRDAAHRYHDAVGVAAEHVLGYQGLARLDRDLEVAVPGVTTQRAYPTLRGHLALRMLAGDDATVLTTTAAAAGELHTAVDTAAVIDWRIGGGDTGGPLPWLPGVPARLAADPVWGRYLANRSTLVKEHVDVVADAANAWTPATAPTWARRLLEPDHRDLLADTAVWRAAHDVDDQDGRPTGPLHPGIDEQQEQRRLDQRIRVALAQPLSTTRRWDELVSSIDTRITNDPYWPDLADRFTAIDRAGIDIAGLATTVAAERPLPDEQPAAALWWRLAGHLTPAVVNSTGHPSQAERQSPPWVPTLAEVLGRGSADRIITDPAWPALVGAVGAGSTAGWDPTRLLGVACDQVRKSGDLHDAELAEALVWRLGLLTDPEPVDRAQLPDDPATADTLPPDDARLAQPASRPVTPCPAAPSTPATQPPVGLSPAHERRLLHLNQEALSYYRNRYHDSWAPAYLQSRLGTDLRDDPRFAVGYAPAGWSSLVTHLRRLGGDDADIVDVGLGRVAHNGNLIDVFRDRLVFPLYDPYDALVGFIGRRNPDHDNNDGDKPGPRYLNTRSTPLFSKREQLFGVHEGAQGLRAGGAAALVEGPLDAIAVTHATDGQVVGVAPLGTAFTNAQADQLFGYLTGGRVFVGTDADPAGWASAKRSYWMLAARGCDPGHLALPAGSDPASLLQTGGPEAVNALVRDAAPLAHRLLDAAIDGHDPATGVGRLGLVQAAGRIIGAQPPERWLAGIDHVARRVDLPPGRLHREIMDSGIAWTDNPHTQADRRLAELTQNSQPATRPPVERWRHLVSGLNAGLTSNSQWRSLADTIDAADRRGYDVTARLRHLARGLPMTDPQQATRELRYRIIADADLPPPPQPIPARTRADSPSRPPPSSQLAAAAMRRGPDR